MILNLWSSCLSLPSARFSGMCHHVQVMCWGCSLGLTLVMDILYQQSYIPSLSDVCNVYVGVFCLHVCFCTTCIPSAHGDQKRRSDSLELQLHCCELPCGFWESNPDPLEEQHCSHPVSHLLALKETLILVYEIRSHVVQVSLELVMDLRLAWNSRFCLYLSSGRIIGFLTWTGSACFDERFGI